MKHDIRTQTSVIFDLAQQATWHYVKNKYKNNFSGNGDDFIYRLRASIQHRVQAIGWHYLELLERQAVAEHKHLHIKGDDGKFDHLLFVLQTQTFLFDDVVFNQLSLFEYVGNLIGYFYEGERGKKNKWKGMAKSARDARNAFSRHPVATIIAKEDSAFVTKLEDYRAKVFHYKLNQGGVRSRFSYSSGKSSVRIELDAPDEFKVIFPDALISAEEVELLAYAKLAIDRSFQIIEEVFSHLLNCPVEPRNHA